MTENAHSREFTFSDIVYILGRHIKIMVLVPVVGTAVAGAIAFSLKPEYEARGYIEVGRVLEKPLEEPVAVADRMRSRAFLEGVKRELKCKETSLELSKRVKVDVVYRQPASQEEPTRAIAVTATATNAVLARDLVAAILTKVVKQHQKPYLESFGVNDEMLREMEKDMAQSRAEIDRGYADLGRLTTSGQASSLDVMYISSYLREKEDHVLRLQELTLEMREMLYAEVFTKPTTITVEPMVPDAPSGPHRIRIIIVAFAVSFIVAAVLAFFRARFPGRDAAATATGEQPSTFTDAATAPRRRRRPRSGDGRGRTTA